MESIHEKLEKVRKPRVHIKYEVETEGKVVQKELPFVVGVMGNFSGDVLGNIKPLKERKFIQIDRDNFNSVMAKLQPKLQFKVNNILRNDGSQLSINLKFNNISDFGPEQIISQVEPLQKLLNIRNRLRDLLTKADRSEDLEQILEKILQDPIELTHFADELGVETIGDVQNGG